MKVALIFRHAAHYRKSIYHKIDMAFNADFYFAKEPQAKLKMLSEKSLRNINYTLKECNLILGFYYLIGMNRISIRKYDYIIIAGDIRDISSWIILFKSYFIKTKVILWTHGWYGKENAFIKYIKILYYSFASEILVYGDYAKNLLIQNRVDSNKVNVIYNSLDTDESKNILKNLVKSEYFRELFKNNFKNLIFIGRLTKVKKIEQLIKSIYLLKQSGHNFNLFIIGSGETFSELFELVKTFDLSSNVKFHGESYDEKFIAQAIFDADLCVSPGNVGLTAIHSLSYGTPVITHNDFKNQMPEFEIIIEGKTGLFFEKDSVTSLSDTIIKWFEIFPNKNIEVQENCFDIVFTRYNSDIQVEILYNILHK